MESMCIILIFSWVIKGFWLVCDWFSWVRWIRVRGIKNSIICSNYWWLETLGLARVVFFSVSPQMLLKISHPLLVLWLFLLWFVYYCTVYPFIMHLCVSFELIMPPAGVDFKVKYVTMGGKKLKLAIWDTGICSLVLFVNYSFTLLLLLTWNPFLLVLLNCRYGTHILKIFALLM